MNFKHRFLLFTLNQISIRKFFINLFRNNKKDNNMLVLVKTNGKRVNNPKLKNVKVIFRGKNNYIEIQEPFSVSRKMIFSCCGNSIVKIGKYNKYTECEIYIGNNTTLEIGNNTTIGGGQLVLYPGPNTKIKIGNDCMISTDVSIRTSDGHTIYSTENNQVTNLPEDVIIGDHVWVGTRSLILKGAEIPSNTIIAANSLVTKKFEKENCIIGGQAAKIIKEGFNWDRKSALMFDKE